MIYIRLWRRRQSYDQCIEIAKYRTVFLENTAVSLVDHNEIKMPRCKETRAVLRLHLIDGVHDGWIGRENRACGRAPVALEQIAGREIRQMLRECLLCLTHQLCAIGEKKHVRYPSMREQDIHQ